MNPLLMTDGYKTSHHKMYPEGTNLVYSNYTPRSVKRMEPQAKKILVFGIQYMILYIHELYQTHFFNRKKEEVIGEAKQFLDSYLNTDYDVSHFEALHDLGYLPIEIKALEEGTIVNEKIPILTIKNTHKDFFWLTNFLETLISSLLWKPLHSASLAYAYKKILLEAAEKTDKTNLDFVDFQAHDFSFRGMQHPESAISSGLGFLTCFKGTDTIPALEAAHKYYGDLNVGFSVPASEHAVMTAYGKEDEFNAFQRLLNQYPTGYLSVVSDSFNLWDVLTVFLPKLKSQILSRNGKLIIRPDSGDPVDIICGTDKNFKVSNVGIKGIIYHEEENKKPEHIGAIELLWDVFGGTINEQGYKVLDPHIGAIYGDSITLDRAEQICKRLESKGFASTNVVLGVGSYSMGYATRDNQGGAVKATYVEVNEVGRDIFKDPVTDDGTKKSAKGLVSVLKVKETTITDSDGKITLVPESYYLKDQCTWQEEQNSLLKTVYKDGNLQSYTTLTEIRDRIWKKTI